MITRMVNAMEYLDDNLITEAMERRNGHRGTWMHWGFAAASLTIMLTALFWLLPTIFKGKESENILSGRYKDFSIQSQGEISIVWPWEYQTAGEKYRTLKLNGFVYESTVNRVSESWLGADLGIHTVNGYDMIKEEAHEIPSQVFSLQSASTNMVLAVKLENEYYVFRNYEHLPQSTLGELLDQVHLQEIVKLNWFEERGGTSKSGRYVLNDSVYLWDILNGECRDAEFIEDQNWMMQKRESLNFSISSEVLGIRNVALYVTADGYLWTNAFGRQSLYDIGTETAGKIIRLCKENSTKIEVQPFTPMIIGTITEIGDDYFVVDDSSLCKDPKEGIRYKVLLNDIRISRYVAKEVIRAGDTVEVFYDGLIDEDNDHIIESAIAAEKVMIVNGSMYTNE